MRPRLDAGAARLELAAGPDGEECHANPHWPLVPQRPGAANAGNRAMLLAAAQRHEKRIQKARAAFSNSRKSLIA